MRSYTSALIRCFAHNGRKIDRKKWITLQSQKTQSDDDKHTLNIESYEKKRLSILGLDNASIALLKQIYYIFKSFHTAKRKIYFF